MKHRRRARAVSLVGQTFGYLTVLRREGISRRYALWRCSCTCGAECLARSDRLRNGNKKACCINGHRWTEHLKGRPPGITRMNASEYKSWESMRSRCLDKKHPHYKHYGGRGITICPAWESFATFLADMGTKPSPEYTIERNDVNGNYEPSNCRWATRADQYRNQQRSIYVEHEGRRVLLMDLVEEHGVSRGIVYGRLKNGWPLDRALLEPVKHYKKKTKKRQSSK